MTAPPPPSGKVTAPTEGDFERADAYANDAVRIRGSMPSHLARCYLHLRAELDRVRAERRWIPVAERLPEIPQRRAVAVSDVVLILPREDAFVARYTKSGWSVPGITHWQALPPEPGE